jgi:hypothetical protein
MEGRSKSYARPARGPRHLRSRFPIPSCDLNRANGCKARWAVHRPRPDNWNSIRNRCISSLEECFSQDGASVGDALVHSCARGCHESGRSSQLTADPRTRKSGNVRDAITQPKQFRSGTECSSSGWVNGYCRSNVDNWAFHALRPIPDGNRRQAGAATRIRSEQYDVFQ